MSDPLISDQINKNTVSETNSSMPVLLVNKFTPKKGNENDFMEAQKNEYKRLKGSVPGFIGNRLGRAIDGSGFVNIAIFENFELYQKWRESEEFTAHVDVIRPYLENSAPRIYEIVYSDGDI